MSKVSQLNQAPFANAAGNKKENTTDHLSQRKVTKLGGFVGTLYGLIGTLLSNVRLIEELDKEVQIAEVHGTTHQEDVPVALAVGDGAGRLDVEEVTENGAADDELNDLDGRDELRYDARGADLDRTQEKVEVHDSVDDEVKRQSPAAPSLLRGVGDLGVDEREGVVVPVHENERSLAQNKEQRISQFGRLRNDEEPSPVTRIRIIVVLGIVAI